MKNQIFIIASFLSILFYSCEDSTPPLTPEQETLLNNAIILLTMDDENFDLTISVSKFADVSIMSLSVTYNYNKYNINNYQVGDATLTWTNLDNPNLNHETAEFLFSSIKDDKDLVTIDFAKPSNYEGTRIMIGNILIKDNNGESIYFSCSDPEYNDPYLCSLGGGSWHWNGNEFTPLNICYISQYAPGAVDSNGKPEYLFGGEYQWSNQYCDYQRDDGP